MFAHMKPQQWMYNTCLLRICQYTAWGLHLPGLKTLILDVYEYNYLLTYSMVQSHSWAANWFAASQEIPQISRNPKVHYRIHKRITTQKKNTGEVVQDKNENNRM